jgi:hypothetical protein
LVPGMAVAQNGAPQMAVTAPDGSPVQWSRLLEQHGPVAVLFWASWAPRGRSTLASCGRMREAARKRGLELLIVDVQESLPDARYALSNSGIPWVHDRYGRLLRRYRVLRIPRLLVIAKDGGVTARLEPRAEALEGKP